MAQQSWSEVQPCWYRPRSPTTNAAIRDSSKRSSRELGDRYCEAQILIHTGEVRIDDGDPAGGRDAFRQAWSILREIGHPDADQVQARLGRPPAR